MFYSFELFGPRLRAYEQKLAELSLYDPPSPPSPQTSAEGLSDTSPFQEAIDAGLAMLDCIKPASTETYGQHFLSVVKLIVRAQQYPLALQLITDYRCPAKYISGELKTLKEAINTCLTSPATDNDCSSTIRT